MPQIKDIVSVRAEGETVAQHNERQLLFIIREAYNHKPLSLNMAARELGVTNINTPNRAIKKLLLDGKIVIERRAVGTQASVYGVVDQTTPVIAATKPLVDRLVELRELVVRHPGITSIAIGKALKTVSDGSTGRLLELGVRYNHIERVPGTRSWRAKVQRFETREQLDAQAERAEKAEAPTDSPTDKMKKRIDPVMLEVLAMRYLWELKGNEPTLYEFVDWVKEVKNEQE
jgi:hypothetical protein